MVFYIKNILFIREIQSGGNFSDVLDLYPAKGIDPFSTYIHADFLNALIKRTVSVTRIDLFCIIIIVTMKLHDNAFCYKISNCDE